MWDDSQPSDLQKSLKGIRNRLQKCFPSGSSLPRIWIWGAYSYFRQKLPEKVSWKCNRRCGLCDRKNQDFFHTFPLMMYDAIFEVLGATSQKCDRRSDIYDRKFGFFCPGGFQMTYFSLGKLRPIYTIADMNNTFAFLSFWHVLVAIL